MNVVFAVLETFSIMTVSGLLKFTLVFCVLRTCLGMASFRKYCITVCVCVCVCVCARAQAWVKRYSKSESSSSMRSDDAPQQTSCTDIAIAPTQLVLISQLSISSSTPSTP